MLDIKKGVKVIAVKNRDGLFQGIKVASDIYIYIKQLEGAIKNPEKSRIKELYPERF